MQSSDGEFCLCASASDSFYDFGVIYKSLCMYVCPCVCPSVKCVHCDKTEEKSVHIFILCERSISLVLCEEEW